MTRQTYNALLYDWSVYLSEDAECTLIHYVIVFKNPNLLFGKFRHAMVSLQKSKHVSWSSYTKASKIIVS